MCLIQARGLYFVYFSVMCEKFRQKSAVLIIFCKVFEANFRKLSTFLANFAEKLPTKLIKNPNLIQFPKKPNSFGNKHFFKEKKDIFKALN